jgi:hypothetical protein
MTSELRHTRRQIVEFAAIYVYWFLISGFALEVEAGFTEYVMLFALPPLVYLCTRLGRYARKIVVQVAIASLFFVLSTDILAHVTGAWVINGSLGYVLYESTVVDNFIWAMLYGSLILTWYQYFFDRYKTYRLDARLRLYALGMLLGNLSFTALWLVLFPYIQPVNGFFYAALILPMIVFTASAAYVFPRLRHKVLLAAATAVPASVLYEYTSLLLNHWTFEKGSFVLSLPFAGTMVPMEEFLWFFFAVTFFIYASELFLDDAK